MRELQYVYKLNKNRDGEVLDKIIVTDTPYIIYRITYSGYAWYDIYKNEKLVTSRNTPKSAIEHVEKLIDKEIKQMMSQYYATERND